MLVDCAKLVDDLLLTMYPQASPKPCMASMKARFSGTEISDRYVGMVAFKAPVAIPAIIRPAISIPGPFAPVWIAQPIREKPAAMAIEGLRPNLSFKNPVL